MRKREKPAVAKLLRAALTLLGPNGHKWTKGTWRKTTPSGRVKYCADGAVCEAAGMYGADPAEYNRRTRTLAARVLDVATKEIHSTFGGVMAFNDRRSTKFSDIKRIFRKAIRDLEAP